jgi:hypothetical protein
VAGRVGNATRGARALVVAGAIRLAPTTSASAARALRIIRVPLRVSSTFSARADPAAASSVPMSRMNVGGGDSLARLAQARLSSFEYCHSALSSVRTLTPAPLAICRHAARYPSQKLTGYCERGLTPSDSSARMSRIG